MLINSIPFCFYPTTIVVVDDNQAFAKSLCLNLSGLANCISYNNPIQARDYLSKINNRSFLETYLSQENESLENTPQISIDFDRFPKEASNSHRFKQISVAIIDYTMPGMNGVELCRELKSKNFKKIMLTGEADHNIAVEAFNEGIIDQFIMKGASDMITILEKAVVEMQNQYFNDLSQIIIQAFSNSKAELPSHFTDAKFRIFFYNFLNSNKIVEFYVFDQEGNYLLINQNGKISWLIIKDEASMDLLVKQALNEHKQEPTDESESIVKAIEDRKKIPIFNPGDDTPEISEWASIMHSIQEFDGSSRKYFYAHVSVAMEHPLYKTIVTFAQQE